MYWLAKFRDGISMMKFVPGTYLSMNLPDWYTPGTDITIYEPYYSYTRLRIINNMVYDHSSRKQGNCTHYCVNSSSGTTDYRISGGAVISYERITKDDINILYSGAVYCLYKYTDDWEYVIKVKPRKYLKKMNKSRFNSFIRIEMSHWVDEVYVKFG